MPLPSKKIVTYKARETPSDPHSAVLMEHKVFITAKSQDGNDITWGITTLKFNQPSGSSWKDSSPGLSEWVVTHADPENPVAKEFTAPPAMNGRASLATGSGDELDYGFTPGTCLGSAGQMYGGAVACAQYGYVAGTTTIAEEDDDEPAETEVVDDPS